MNIFEGLKVVELASVLAGPAVGMFFAELGAVVVKIENAKTRGDVTRQWKLPSEPKTKTDSAYYNSINWGKQSILLDVSQVSDLQIAYQYIKEADIVIVNYKFGDASKLKLSYTDIKAIKSDIIYGEITAFGQASPRIGFDVVLQAESGFMYMNGKAGEPPVKMPVALIDILTAHQLKEGILLALIKKLKTGEGALVHVSLIDSAIASLANQATNWLIGKHIPQPMGSLHPNIAPYGELFTTADNKLLVLAVGSNKQFKALCTCLQLKELKDDPRFLNNVDRVRNRQTLQQILQRKIAIYERSEFINLCTQNAIPAGAIRNMEEVFNLPEAQKLLLNFKNEQGMSLQCVKSVVFTIQ